MMSEDHDNINHLSSEDVLAIHELIVESNDETEPGVASPGDIEYIVTTIEKGHFGQVPESIHEKGYQLLRLIAANHPFVDGNKRTALMSARVSYALNGCKFNYDKKIKRVLKSFATDQGTVEEEKVITYLAESRR
jgi:death-on-curing protein